MKRILLMLLCVMFGMAGYAYDVAIENDDGVTIYYNLNGKEAIVCGSVTCSDLFIPSTIKNEGVTYRVDSISPNAFKNRDIKNLSFGDGDFGIGSMAFYGCSSLETINFGNGNYAMYYSGSKGTFEYCTSLSQINFGNGNYFICDASFRNCTSLESLSLGDGEYDIVNEAFGGPFSKGNIKTLILGSGSYDFEGGAFGFCTNLNTVYSYNENPKRTTHWSTTNNSSWKYWSSYGRSIYEATLYVPYGTKSKYKGISYWNLFTDIVEMEKADEGETSDNMLTYKLINNSELCVVGCTRSYKDAVVIPSKAEYNSKTYPVTSIELAFVNAQISELTIPASIKSISTGSFNASEELKAIHVDKNNQYYCDIDGVLFTKDKKTLVRYPTAKGETYEVPEGVTTIIDGAFYDEWYRSSNPKSVKLPSTLTKIDSHAFEWCGNLTEITLPSKLREIGDSAFLGCANLLTIYSEVEEPFATPITAFYATDYRRSDLYDNATLYVPYGTSSLYKSMNYWNKFANIKESAKETDDILSYKLISSSYLQVTGCDKDFIGKLEIPSEAYYEGTTYPVKSINSAAFSGHTGITSVIIPSSITYIGALAFDDCINMESVEVSSLNGNYCSVDGVLFNKEKTIIIYYPPKKADTIYEIPQTVMTITRNTFENSKNLTTLIMPSGITSIGIDVIDCCYNLTNLVCYMTTPPTITSNVFDDVNEASPVHYIYSTVTLTVPYESLSSYKSANYWKNFYKIESIGTADEQNYIYSDGVECRKGTTVKLPVSLSNEINISGLQFDLSLPSGVTMSTDEDGEYVIENTTRSKNHIIQCAKQTDGSYRVIMFSLSNKAFTDSDGEVLYISLDISDEMKAGNYVLSFSNIRMVELDGEETILVSDKKCTLMVTDGIMGDVNYDGTVDVTDVMMIARKALGLSPSGFNEASGDLNGDRSFDVTDVMMASKIALISVSSSNIRKNLRSTALSDNDAAESNYVYCSDIVAERCDEVELPINLSNTDEIAAFQFSIELPEGTKFAMDEDDELMYELTSRAKKHIVSYNQIDDTHCNIMVFSLSNKPISDNDGVVLNLTVNVNEENVNGKVKLSGVKLNILDSTTTTFASDKTSTFAVGDVSGIDDILGNDVRGDIYDLQGRKVTMPGKGIYIINGKKVLTR